MAIFPSGNRIKQVVSRLFQFWSLPQSASNRLEMSCQKKLSSFFSPTTKKPWGSSEMSSQKKLDSFFTPTAKRTLESSDTAIGVKKTKLSECESANVEETKENIPSQCNVLSNELSSYCEKLEILDKRMGLSWFKALKNEFDKPYFKKLNDFVVSERKKNVIYPPDEMVWTWTRQCSIESIKVVILGQDPYHNPGQAHGLCFSVPIGVAAPPSLLNMYKELESDINDFKIPKHGYLVGWARQGVLLLNAVLTVRKNAPNSHKDQGWEELTTAVIKYLNENQKGIVFLLWGAYAQKKADFVDKKKHFVLKTVHPSPLSASRGWFGCEHFSKCNEYLEKVGKKPVDWTRLPEK
ncbi:uracil-DNA glycosylase [Halyomorpha halys]|uniref:uracil-DNA glycosylase n=1 Tax=Halyomorpha halys TaxID=286706 RepID=UPI0006D52598|nr:uncharacterized protein LOC106692520 [Halyomorpha halys]